MLDLDTPEVFINQILSTKKLMLDTYKEMRGYIHSMVMLRNKIIRRFKQTDKALTEVFMTIGKLKTT